MYRVYYMNNYKRSFHTRDAALDYIMASPEWMAHEDFEILDRSDDL